jgi:hypothetical protein
MDRIGLWMRLTNSEEGLKVGGLEWGMLQRELLMMSYWKQIEQISGSTVRDLQTCGQTFPCR